MSQILLTLSIPGAILLFVLIKTGMRLIIPFAICVVAGMLGMVVFIWASADPIAPNDPEFAINPVSVRGCLCHGCRCVWRFAVGRCGDRTLGQRRISKC